MKYSFTAVQKWNFLTENHWSWVFCLPVPQWKSNALFLSVTPLTSQRLDPAPGIISDSSLTPTRHQVLMPLRFRPLHAQSPPLNQCLCHLHLNDYDSFPTPSRWSLAHFLGSTAAFFLGPHPVSPPLNFYLPLSVVR